jgi:Fe-S cluster assembly ATPase SufC
VLVNGKLVDSGGPQLVHRLESEGYEPYLQDGGQAAAPQPQEVAAHGR